MHGGFLFPNLRAFAHFWKYQTVRGHTTRLHDGFFSKFGVFCPVLTTRLYEGKHPDYGSIFPCRKTILFNNIIHLLHSGIHCELGTLARFCTRHVTVFGQFLGGYQTVREHITKLHGGRLFRIWGLRPIFDYQTARVYHPDDGCFFLAENRSYSILVLLHTCIHCDLDHSCSILHTAFDQFFSEYQNLRGYITRLHDGFFTNLCASAHFLLPYCTRATTMKMAAIFTAENRSFSILLLLAFITLLPSLRLRPLLLHTPQETRLLSTNFSDYQNVREHITRLYVTFYYQTARGLPP